MCRCTLFPRMCNVDIPEDTSGDLVHMYKFLRVSARSMGSDRCHAEFLHMQCACSRLKMAVWEKSSEWRTLFSCKALLFIMIFFAAFL